MTRERIYSITILAGSGKKLCGMPAQCCSFIQRSGETEDGSDDQNNSRSELQPVSNADGVFGNPENVRDAVVRKEAEHDHHNRL